MERLPRNDSISVAEAMAEPIGRISFVEEEIAALRHSIDIAEDVISDFYRISTSEWKRYRYDIQSLRDLAEEEITDEAFAQIHRYSRSPHLKMRGSEPGDYFKICLQDHVIRKATERDSKILFLPLTTYIVTHELIHVVRFARFLRRFESTPAEREIEECIVHDITFQLLENYQIRGMPEVLRAFKDCRTMETFLGSPP